MRAAIAIAVLVTACHGDADGPRLQLVYDVDLDRAVDDKAAVIRDDLVADLGPSAKSIAISATGDLQVIPSDAARRDQVRDAIEQPYRGDIEWRPCDADVGEGALCLTISAAYVKTLKQAALAQAVKTIQERLAASKQKRATVTARGQQIVIELPAIDDEQREAVKDVLGRRGRVELKVVDDGSDYMKRVYARIGSDPSLSAASIGAEVDSWTSDSGSRHTDYYLVAADKGAIERFVADLAAADPAFKVPDDRELGFERIEARQPGDRVKWRSYYLERAASLTGAAIADARVDYDQTTNRPIVQVELGRYGTRVFAELTERIVGKKLATIVDGRITSVPVVETPILGGRLVISMGGSDQATMQRDADGLAVVLRAGALPSPLVLASQHIVP
jgi:preprotein translocase subunit SecD